MVRATDCNCHKPQSDKGSMSHTHTHTHTRLTYSSEQALCSELSLLLGDGEGDGRLTRRMHFGHFANKGESTMTAVRCHTLMWVKAAENKTSVASAQTRSLSEPLIKVNTAAPLHGLRAGFPPGCLHVHIQNGCAPLSQLNGIK